MLWFNVKKQNKTNKKPNDEPRTNIIIRVSKSIMWVLQGNWFVAGSTLICNLQQREDRRLAGHLVGVWGWGWRSKTCCLSSLQWHHPAALCFLLRVLSCMLFYRKCNFEQLCPGLSPPHLWSPASWASKLRKTPAKPEVTGCSAS